jgi:hypothetical protein
MRCTAEPLDKRSPIQGVTLGRSFTPHTRHMAPDSGTPPSPRTDYGRECGNFN